MREMWVRSHENTQVQVDGQAVGNTQVDGRDVGNVQVYMQNVDKAGRSGSAEGRRQEDGAAIEEDGGDQGVAGVASGGAMVECGVVLLVE